MLDVKIVELGLVGNDGMAGLTALMGDDTSPDRAIVQVPNGATRLPLRVIKEEFGRGELLHKLLLAYARELMRQVSQTAACNASQTAEEPTFSLAVNVFGSRGRRRVEADSGIHRRNVRHAQSDSQPCCHGFTEWRVY